MPLADMLVVSLHCVPLPCLALWCTPPDPIQIVINLGGHRDMLGVGVFDGHSGQEASKYVAANLWNAVGVLCACRGNGYVCT